MNVCILADYATSTGIGFEPSTVFISINRQVESSFTFRPLARQGCFPGCLRIIQWRFHMTNEVAYRWLDHYAPCACTSIHTKRSSIDYISCTGNKNGRHLARDHPQESSSSLLADCIIKFSIIHIQYYSSACPRLLLRIVCQKSIRVDC